ncbi:MAG: hypothetical protein FWC47_02640 [Oscillospiraceae bacterium]|nr:hypothetical protein [Oscillospiraceae bacterium]
MKLKLFFIGCISLIIAISGILLITSNNTTAKTQKVAIYADYPSYDNLQNLIDKADTIIKGKVIDFNYSYLNIIEKPESDNEFLNPGGEKDTSSIPYTIFTVEINKVYKGSVNKKDIIEIKQLGGTLGNIEYIDKNAAKLNIGGNYIFFLETYPNSPASLLNPIQGSYEYDNNDNIIPNKGNKINFNIKDLDLKMKDLNNIDNTSN